MKPESATRGWDERRWQRLQELFEASSELPRPEQASFVERQTLDDPVLRDELARMLEYTNGAGELISETIERIAQATVSSNSWIGRRFGSWRIVREIGRGGMGMVFEAVRDDDEYRKRVALKVAPDWRQVSVLHERFRHERQIIAQLEHPNVARFLDGGTEDGIPFFVMEYVEGRPITEYTRELPLQERIELFRQVCAVVEYAHANLVVHRDLKPSNILVSEEGQVKLLDFGIAKLLDPLAGGDGAAATSVMMWTPDYASPEQVRGEAVTTRTDVYSLGLVLFEILSGAQAQKADTSSPLALDRSICENEPTGTLTGDLDSIIRMAIRKEPDRRYSSVTAFSEDLLRFLDGHPVAARPSTVMYRAGKFASRHRIGMAAGALLAASIVGGIVSTVHQARRANRRFEEVRQLANAFVFDVHDRIANLPGSTEARKVIVQTALRYLENLRHDAASDVALLREIASAYERIGDVQGLPTGSNLNDTDGALRSYRNAESILTTLVQQRDSFARRQLASVYGKLAVVSRARGETKEALTRYAQARAATQQEVAAAPTDSKALQLLAGTLIEIVQLSIDMGDAAAAENAASEQIEVAGRLVALDASNRDHRFSLSSAHMAFGYSLLSSLKLEQAAQSYRRGIQLREELVKEDPTNTLYGRNLMTALGNLGDLLGTSTGCNLGDTAGAADALQKALSVADWLTCHDPADRKAQFDLASAQLRYGSLLVNDASQVENGLVRLRDAEQILERLLAEDPNNYRCRYNLMFVARRIGDGLAALGRTQDAAGHWERVVAVAPQLLAGPLAGSTRFQKVLASVQLAMMHARAGVTRAVELANAIAFEVRQPPPFVSPWNEAAVCRDLGRVYLEMGRRTEAVEWLEHSSRQWSVLQVPVALEARRRAERAAVEADLRNLSGSGTGTPRP